MIRSFLVALVTVVVVSGPWALGRLAAQPAATANQSFPITIEGGTPGVSIEFFLNSGKLADAIANSTGGVDSVLDMGNMGKTTVQIYIDVCKDGKIVKVMFVTAGNQPPPKDEDCDRRLVAAGFQSDCGVTLITIDIRAFGANVIGCGNALRDPKVLGIAGGALLGVLAIVARSGGDGPSAVVTTPLPQPSVTAPQPAPTNITSPNPQPPAAAPQGAFTIVLVVHPSGAITSLICGVFSINPPTSGTTFTLTASGPAVLPNQNVTGTFNSSGQAAWRLGIGNVGTYTLIIIIRTPNGATATTSTIVNVTSSGASQCPTVAA